MPFLIPVGAAIAGAIVHGRKKSRDEDNARIAQDRATALAAAEFNRQTPGIRAGHAVRGDVLAGIQPYQISGSGRNLSSTGGLSPALLSQDTRDLGRQMSREAYLSAMGGTSDPVQRMKEALLSGIKKGDVQNPANMQETLSRAMGLGGATQDRYSYTPQPFQRPGKLDRVLGGVSTGLSLLPLLPFPKPEPGGGGGGSGDGLSSEFPVEGDY